jgi:hypothetical protein
MDKIIMHAIGHMGKDKSLEKFQQQMKLCSCMKFDNIEMQSTIWMKLIIQMNYITWMNFFVYIFMHGFHHKDVITNVEENYTWMMKGST